MFLNLDRGRCSGAVGDGIRSQQDKGTWTFEGSIPRRGRFPQVMFMCLVGTGNTRHPTKPKP